MAAIKYKVCRNCGNKIHPRSRQCPWCCASLGGWHNWFAILVIVLIAALIAVVAVYSFANRGP